MRGVEKKICGVSMENLLFFFLANVYKKQFNVFFFNARKLF